FNALARREAAIVTEEPGTTRDLLEVVLDLEGMRVRVTDTAGLRETPGRIEAIGIERARSKAGTADLLLVLEDMVDPVPIGAIPADVPSLRIGTKADLLQDKSPATRYDAVISTRDGAGLAELLAEIGHRAAAQIGQAGDILPSRLRHVELLNETKRFLLAAGTEDERGQELRAEELRLAADRLGRIVGAVDVEEMLDVIFSQFCIGK
ncbi:MAG: tRNA uridine-5-carboxymethylaminomethyl(34) synthesis GTPase MnmE, partial [Mesorhizobium sp.]